MKMLRAIGKGFHLIGDFCISPPNFKRKVDQAKLRKRNEKIRKEYQNNTIYYVIRSHAETFGIATSIRGVLSHIKYAVDNGWVPVVDLQNSPNPYLEKDEIGKKNAWEFYFNQPCGVKLKDIEYKNNVIYTEQNQLDVCPTDSIEFYTNEFCVNYWKAMYQKYIVLNEETEKYIEEQYKKIIGEHKVLGCVCRGTDYVERRAYMHPIQPLPEELINEAGKLMIDDGYDKLFLATEDDRILKMFQESFGDKLVFVEQQRYSEGKVLLALQKEFAKNNGRRFEGLQYLTAIYLLAKCDALIGGRCGMSTISYLIAQKYDYVHLWNIGRYGIDDYCLPEKYR